MDREQIIQKFQNLNVWKRADQRAVHKPLLVLYAIGKLLRSEGRLISYADIEEELRNLLREFGPWRSTHNPQFPFWRLQNDGIWEVSDAANIRQTASGDAYITDLRSYNVSGGFPEPIAYQLQNDSKLAFEIIQNLLDAHFPFSYHEDILQAVGIPRLLQMPHLQPRTPKFRENVLKAYAYRCAVCGFDVKLRHQPVALEAAHIKWRMADGPDTVENGIALCSLHHKLFDRGAFTLSEELKIQVSEYVNRESASSQEWLMQFDSREIKFPPEKTYYPNEDFINWHLKEVFKAPYREKT